MDEELSQWRRNYKKNITISLLFFGVVFFICWLAEKGLTPLALIGAIILIIAAVVGFSRVYLDDRINKCTNYPHIEYIKLSEAVLNEL